MKANQKGPSGPFCCWDAFIVDDRSFMRPLFALVLRCLLFAPVASAAEEAFPRSTWMNFGMYSFHGKEDVPLNNENYGFGIEYKYAPTQSITAGTFKNSDFEQSRYLGWYWLPLQWGPVRFGGIFGVIDGYSKALNGNFFPAILPAISYEGSRFGVNIYPIPGFENRLYTALTIQLKIKMN